MKKMFNTIRTAGKKMYARTILVIGNNRGSGFVDQAVQILISIVIGALLLAGLYALFGDMIMPGLRDRIQDMFNYAG